MKLNIVVFCLVLSLPVLLQATSVFSSEFKTELKKTSFGKSIIGLEQLAAKFGSQGIYDQLYQAIDDLIAKLQSQLGDENSIFSDVQQNHDTLIANLEASISQLNDLVTSQQIVLDSSNAQVDSLTSLINQLNDQLSSDNDQIQSKTDARQAEQAANQQKMSDLNAAISAAQDAIAILSGLQNQTPSLIQTSTQMKTATENLKQSIKKVTKKMFYLTLIQALESQNYANQDVLQQILNLLNELLNNFQNDLASLQSYEAGADADFQTAINNLNQDISTVQDSLVTLGQQLDDANASIASATDAINSANEQLVTLNSQLDTENSNFQSATSGHNDLVDEIQREIAIAQQAETYLQQNLTEVSLE